jgi:tetratricopeptide (TPR) repeat protein
VPPLPAVHQGECLPGRFTFHDLLRAFASERCQAEETAEQRDKAVSRLALWYLATADAADRLLAPLRRHVRIDPADSMPLPFRDYEAALAWCEAERENLVATVQVAAETGHHEQAWKLAIALVTFFHLRKHRLDRLTTCNIALESARQIQDKWGEAWSILSIGAALTDLRRPDDAITAFREALGKWRELGDGYGQAMALNNLSEVYCDIGRFDDSLPQAHEALLLWEQIGNRRSEAITLNCMGVACDGLGRPSDAITYLERALRAAHGADRYTEGISLHLLGISFLKLGQLQEARASFHEALTCQRETGDRYGEAQTLRDLAKLQHQLDDTTGARYSLRLAMSIFYDLTDPQLSAVEAEMDQFRTDS